VEHRPEIAEAHPGETVGTITSILASIWRSMPADAKFPYVEFARQFDGAQGIRRRSSSRQTPVRTVKTPLVLPSIYVVKRIGCSDLIQEASLNSLMQAMEDKGFWQAFIE
jgi:hypothetical protein